MADVLAVRRFGGADGLPDRCLAYGLDGSLTPMSYKPTPYEEIEGLPPWEIGIEQTRGAPRPWIWNAEAARQHRLEHPSPLRRLLIELGFVKRRCG
jgi:hypothetical protein